MKSCNYNKDYTCKLCGKIYKGNRGLGLHLSKIHIKVNDIISIQEYFDKYVIINIDEKYCKECENENIFQSLGKGYTKYCSLSCSNKSEERKQNISKNVSKILKEKYKNDKARISANIKKVNTVNFKYAQEFSKNNNYLPYKMLFNDNY